MLYRVTSVNRISSLGESSSGSYSAEQCVVQLIPHLNLNAPRLQQILQGMGLRLYKWNENETAVWFINNYVISVIVTSFKDLKKHKQMFATIPEILHKVSCYLFIERCHGNYMNNL